MRAFMLLSLLPLLLAICLAGAIPKPDDNQDDVDEDHKNRVIEKKLSDEDHWDGEDEDADHNPEYDHEAFLGKEEAKNFDDLTPDESKDRLAIIYEKIDKDKDGQVTEEELKEWIKYVQNKYIWSDTDRQWQDHTVEGDVLKWESYKERTFGFLNENDDEDDQDDDGFSYKEMVRRDERRWRQADGDGDGHLSKDEFANFLHPEEAEHMRDIVIDETLEDIDKNGDGVISLEEYIGDMWPNHDGEDEPEWVKTEREQFSAFRDKNKDGRMDREEVKDWIIPPDYDHSEAEARHLIFESDGDRDGKLSKEEVVSHYDLFVGSQATDFGEALSRHDEF